MREARGAAWASVFWALALLPLPVTAADEPVLQIAETITATLPGTSEQEPEFIREWKQFAEASGRADDQRWVDLIRHPNAVKLSNAWSAWRGFDAPTLVAEARAEGRIPPEVAPGLVITAENVDSIPGLTALMTPELIQQVKSEDWYHIKKIRIVPTSHYYLSAGKLRGFLDETGQFYLDPDNGALRIRDCTTCEKDAVVADDWGQKSVRIPFVPDPATGLELVWAFAQHNVGSDNVAFKPGDFILCDKHNRIERTYSAHLWWKNFWGRATFEPTPSIPGIPSDSYQGGSIFFTHPLDAKGLCGVRIRRFDPDVDDSFAIFVPYLRRTRILSGSDTQDPLCAGCDLIWDDWRGFWQRIDTRETEYTIESKDEFILALPERGMVGDQFEIDDCQFDDMQMEIRPVSRLLIEDRTGKYVYSSRRVWVDRDWWHMQLLHAHDATGRMWRWGSDVRDWDPRTGEASWRSAFITDPINRHGTMLRANSDFTDSMRGTKQEYFDIESLKNYQ